MKIKMCAKCKESLMDFIKVYTGLVGRKYVYIQKELVKTTDQVAASKMQLTLSHLKLVKAAYADLNNALNTPPVEEKKC